ncbi:hypothetical protein SSX86_017549 [Deinandra increscens subsp. villosa]|uniref:Phosphorylated adapter RNA export protein n=1 Tax=Deinandra increscens subsp. villosa TaxID=3103831 RepID=A0AAP0CZR4_9ASTR
MEGEESLLDSIFEGENVEDVEDVDMIDVEEGELVGNNHQVELGQKSSMDGDAVAEESQTKNQKRRNRKKKNKKRKGGSGSDVTDINRFVLDTCKRLRERKSYLIWTAVGCLGVPALSDLVKELNSLDPWASISFVFEKLFYQFQSGFLSSHFFWVDAIQACGGQKTADGSRLKYGGGILWSILKTRDPNVFKEIMKKGKEFEKQFRQPDWKKPPNQNKQVCSKPGGDAAEAEPRVQKDGIEERQTQKRPVHERIRVPVSYEDLVEIEDPKDEVTL